MVIFLVVIYDLSVVSCFKIASAVEYIEMKIKIEKKATANDSRERQLLFLLLNI